MSKWTKVLISALVNGGLTFLTALVASDAGPNVITRQTLMWAGIGAGITALKDIQAYMSKAPE